VQLPGLAATSGQVVAVGGLDAADSSTDGVVRLAPGSPRATGSLPRPAHDIGVAALGGAAYAFGGGTAAGPMSSIMRIAPSGRVSRAGTLPAAMSDTSAATLGGTIYVVGGYTTTTPLRSVLAFRPGRAVRDVATLPHPLRYAAVAAVGGHLLVAGGTDGTRSRTEVLSVDQARHSVRVIAHLPSALGHAAGAALGRWFLVIGGRGDGPGTQRDAIWAIDPAHPRPVLAGRLPVALSDLGATGVHGSVLVAGGRDRTGKVHDEILRLRDSGRAPDVYAADRAGALAAVVRRDPARVYVPNSKSNTVDVVDQRTARIVEHFPVGRLPQHVTPSWDLRTLWVTNDEGNSLTPIDPRTGRPGRPVPVTDPYNLYFTVDGRRAIVVAEAHRELDFRQPHTMALIHALRVPECPGIDHMDYTSDGRRALVSCEFGGRMVVVDLVHERVLRTIPLRSGGMPQDVKVSPDGRTFYVADMASGGVWLIDARTWRVIRLQRTGRGAHGLYPSRDGRDLYVSNRGEGSITVMSFRTRHPVRTWRLPGGGSPDMGGVSADGRVLWLTGRYDGELYAISTRTGRLLHRIRVGSGPHGAAVWPQPGRYSIGHTGIMR
jgi:DNA-binding beta-propeller fold protein YncE